MAKKLLSIILILMLAVMYQVSAGTETIQKIIAAFNYELKIKIDGEVFTPKDEDGSVLRPIIYDGRTYLPVRALGEALGVVVDWNPETKTVDLFTDDSNLGIPYNDDIDKNPVTPSTMPTPIVRAEVVSGKIIVSWDKIISSKFSGYKVVASLSDSTPVYPDDGYAVFITNAATTTYTIAPGSSYNGGDLNGAFVSGKKYYISITAIYGDSKVPGNTIAIVLP